MKLEERTLDDNFSEICDVCGAALTQLEIVAAREAGPPFLCSRHAAEEAPADEVAGADDPGAAGGPPSMSQS